MDPAVLILSYGSVSSKEIAESILGELKQPKLITTNIYETTSVNCYKCDIITKYYNTSISLIPFDGKFESVPPEIKKLTEALVIYFEPSDRTFIKNISGLNDFVESNEIQIGFLVTTSFSGKANELNAEDLREHTNVVFDIVTLKEDDEDADDTQGLNYSEILEGLKNCVWSNVKIGSNRNHSADPEELENQLNDFENLLITAQTLRSDPNLSREELLNKAEQLAEVMSAILNDNDSD
ncbi:uncharacterized protein LOC133842782 [Drosophila sulfurigaster albostrigata]|uniref:uncharacterized protein LOC133842782 n=1 Tax=Drosophila sulfurigaster albostrigata TaxID=89887 RepID=UPI002D21A568|nr:uncharacterized protein LOC133842782 [Drosophila sulfurigaster albostrigata]